jgi:hypothetical protein
MHEFQRKVSKEAYSPGFLETHFRGGTVQSRTKAKLHKNRGQKKVSGYVKKISRFL